jgi:hypothetical protein
VGLSPDGSIYRFRNVDGQNRILHLHASHTTCSFASIENLAAGADVFCIATDDRGELYIEASNQDGTQFLGKLER